MNMVSRMVGNYLQLWKSGLSATILAVVFNHILFTLGSLFTFPNDALTPIGAPVNAGAVAFMTIVAGLAATIGYIVIRTFARPKAARRVLWTAATLILAAMFFSPFAIENVPLAQIVILELMHLVAGVVPVYRLTRT